MSEDLYGQERYDALTDEQKEKLRRLGGGGPERLAPVEQLATAYNPEQPPKRYPPADVLQRRRCREHDDRPVERATADWPEPLCHECYRRALDKPPRAVLTFDDGTREMRRNFIAVKIYRDVLDVGDDVIVRWFEFEREQREGDKLVMQFYRQIKAPVTSIGKPLDFGTLKGAKFKRVSWWRRFIRSVRAWLAVRGIA